MSCWRLLTLIWSLPIAAGVRGSCDAKPGAEGYDQVGGKVLAGTRPQGFINSSSSQDCCDMCANFAGCTNWVRQPSTSHCWLIQGSTGSKARADRSTGGLPPLKPTVFVEEYAAGTFRVRIGFFGPGARPVDGLLGAVASTKIPKPRHISTKFGGKGAPQRLAIGNIEANLLGNGTLEVIRKSDGQLLSTLQDLSAWKSRSDGYYSWKAAFQSFDDEKIWGLGERQTGKLDNKGLTINFKADQKNTHITIPFAISSRQYGVFLNHPGWGQLDLQNVSSTWTVSMAIQLDFLITTSSAEAGVSPYASIVEHYYDAIGHAPALPDWALGFWVSKQRYSSQREIHEVIRNYTEVHGFNVSVLVIDWKHYKCQGDWGFTLNSEVCWPDPAAMVADLKSMGVQQTFVSLHPWAQPGSLNYNELISKGFCLQQKGGTLLPWSGWSLPTCGTDGTSEEAQSTPQCIYDPSNADARAFVWSRLKTGYYDHGITNFWTDGTEPAGAPHGSLPASAVFANGSLPAEASFMYWPVWHSQTIYEGAIAAGGKSGAAGSWSLGRSAWPGSHLRNVIVWSGDILSDWKTLQNQVRAGMNMQLVYPYWNSDTGGFKLGDFRTMGELQARWFQFSMFTSILRLHGSRDPKQPSLIPLQKQCDPTKAAGGPIEPWAYGDEALVAIRAAVNLRDHMRPYIKKHVAILASKGSPVMRPLWFDFPSDDTALQVEDQFMFGPDYMVAPVLEQNATSRKVYFPGSSGSATFTDYFTGKTYEAGSEASVPVTSLKEFPFFTVALRSERVLV